MTIHQAIYWTLRRIPTNILVYSIALWFFSLSLINFFTLWRVLTVSLFVAFQQQQGN